MPETTLYRPAPGHLISPHFMLCVFPLPGQDVSPAEVDAELARVMAGVNDAEAMCAEIKDLRCSVIAFGAPAMITCAALNWLPERHLYAEHYDALKRAGGQMDDFVRHEPAALARNAKENA